MVDLDRLDELFEFHPGVGEMLDDTKPLEELGQAAGDFARRLVRVIPNHRGKRDAVLKLMAVVAIAEASIRESAARKDRWIALSAKAEAQIP